MKDIKKIINRHYNEVLKKLFNITTDDIQFMDHHLEELENDDEDDPAYDDDDDVFAYYDNPFEEN